MSESCLRVSVKKYSLGILLEQLSLSLSLSLSLLQGSQYNIFVPSPSYSRIQIDKHKCPHEGKKLQLLFPQMG
jgi:hypothetical protein